MWKTACYTWCSEHDGERRGKQLLDCVQTPLFTFPPCYWLLLVVLSVCVCVCIYVCVCLRSYQMQLVLSEAKGSGWGRVSDGQIAQCKRLADNLLICRFMCHRLDLFTIFPVSNRSLSKSANKDPTRRSSSPSGNGLPREVDEPFEVDESGTTEGRWKGKKSTLYNFKHLRQRLIASKCQ